MNEIGLIDFTGKSFHDNKCSISQAEWPWGIVYQKCSHIETLLCKQWLSVSPHRPDSSPRSLWGYFCPSNPLILGTLTLYTADCLDSEYRSWCTTWCCKVHRPVWSVFLSGFQTSGSLPKLLITHPSDAWMYKESWMQRWRRDPIIPMKVAQWKMKPKWPVFPKINTWSFPGSLPIFCIHSLQRACALVYSRLHSAALRSVQAQWNEWREKITRN